MPLLLSVRPLVVPVTPPPPCTTTLADGQVATVRAAINAAANGDVICIPAGTWTWGSALTIGSDAAPRYLTIRGMGSGADPATNTIIVDGIGGYLIQWYVHTGGLTRWTGIRMVGSTPPTAASFQMLTFSNRNNPSYNPTLPSGLATRPHIRIDHNHFDVTLSTGPLAFSSAFQGVVDHNIFHRVGNAAAGATFAWGGLSESGVDDPNFGDVQWSEPSTWGTDHQLVFEDNLFDYDNSLGGLYVGASSAWYGARRTARFNTLNNCFPLTNHGTESGGRWRSVRHDEIYGNIMNWNTVAGNNVDMSGNRGGTARVFYNDKRTTTQTQQDIVHRVNNYRYNAPGIGASVPWGSCARLPVASLTREGSTAIVEMLGEENYRSHNQRTRASCFIKIEGANQSEYNGTFLSLDMVITSLTHTGTVCHATTAVKHRMQTGDHLSGIVGANPTVYNVLYGNGTVAANLASTRITRIDDTHFDFTIYTGTGTLVPVDPGVNATPTPVIYFLPVKYITYTITGTPATPATPASTIRYSSPWDAFPPLGNDVPIACLDQPGRGQGQRIAGGNPAATVPTVVQGTGTASWPNQVLDPLYIWQNTWKGALVSTQCIVGPTENPPNQLASNIMKDCREFFRQRATPLFTGVCTENVTPGIGVGPRANRPPAGNLTPGVAWWATDKGGAWDGPNPDPTTYGYHWATGANHGCLDIAISPTQWQDCAYTPLGYPHPLTLVP